MKKGLYTNEKWSIFSNKIKQRDNFTCLTCGRSNKEVTLQVHHVKYIYNKSPWEYCLSDCITLCKGCHAREHRIIEPNSGWHLLSMDDLGGKHGVCERKNCGHEIRYEYLTYHPGWGYKTVGSTCVEHLTQKDHATSKRILQIYKNISDFIHNPRWEKQMPTKNRKFISADYKYHQIRIYGEHNNYSFQIILKEKGQSWFTSKEIINARNKCIEEVKEMSYIVLKGLTTNDDTERNILRNLYKQIRKV